MAAHEGPVLALCFDAGSLYSSGTDGRLITWDLATGTRTQTAEAADPVVALVCAGDGLWKLSRGRLVGPHSAVALDVELHRLLVRGNQLYGVGDRSAVRWHMVDGAAVEDGRWELPDGPTSDAAVHDARLVVVKYDRDVHVVPLDGGATQRWPDRGFYGKKVRRRFVRFDDRGRLWAVGMGVYDAFVVNPDTGKRSRRQTEKQGLKLGTASAGPCELDESGRYLATIHTGEDLEVFDLATGHVQFAVKIDPRVSNEKALAGLSRVPRFKQFGSYLKASSWRPPLPFADGVRALAVAPGARWIALGKTTGQIVVVEPSCGGIVELGQPTPATLTEPSIAVTWFLPEIQAACRSGDHVMLIAGGRMIIVDAGAGTLVRDVTLAGLAPHASVYECMVVGDELRAYMELHRYKQSGVQVWSRDDGRLLRTIEITCVSTLTAAFAFGFDDHNNGTKMTMPLVRRDLMTGECATWTFAPPPGVVPSTCVNWVRMKHLSERLIVELVDRGAWFYNADERELGASLPFDPDRAAVDANGRVAVFSNSNGWGLFDLEQETVLVHHATDEDRGGLTPLDHDVKSGRVALADGRNERIVVWERDGTLVAELPGFADVRHGFFARGGRHLVALDRHVVRIYSTRSTARV